MLEITTHWHLLDGNLQDVINIAYIDEKSSEHPDFPTDIVDQARTIVLERNEEEDQCSLNIRSMNNLIMSVSFAVSYCRRAEIFTGISSIYRETINGTVYSEINELDVYRYDIKFDKGESLVTIKLIPQDSTIVIFGVFINAVERLREPNTFPMGMNLSNLEDLLKDSGMNLSENAQKCKSFLQMTMAGANASKNVPKTSSLFPASSHVPSGSTSVPSDVREFLEHRLKSMEESLGQRIDQRLDEMEKRQNEKFSEILKEIQYLKENK